MWAMRKRWRDFALVGVASFGLVLATNEWRSLFRGNTEIGAERSPRDLRIVTWNVAGGMPLDDIASDRADIALLQEIGALPSGRPRPEALKDFHWIAEFDPGTLSRFPIERLPTRRVGPWQEPQILKTTIAGRTVILVNVRLMLPAFMVAIASMESPPGLVRLHAERVAQFAKLRDLVAETLTREKTRTAILCGDFNSPGGIQSGRVLTPGLRDVWPAGGRGWPATMTAGFPVSRIDQCWVTADVSVHAAQVRRGDSDHRRLVVDLALH
jgi:endonuclease/exonuclease/phosphatase (EEP) superfamily protein YafD